MKIALLYNQQTHETIRALADIIGRYSCDLVSVDAGTVWNSALCKNPVLAFEGATHLVYVYTNNPPDLMTFAFYAGLAIGRGIRVVVIERDGQFRVPENAQHLGLRLKLEKFEDYFEAERVRFQAEEQQRIARKRLLERGYSCFDENFVYVVTSGDTENARLFLEAGFDPGLADQRGIPLLSLAVRAQRAEIAGLLIDSGADVNRLSPDRGYSPLMDAVQKGDADMVRLLISKGADANLKSKDGQTALIVCAGRGDSDMAELLVEAGADPLAVDHLGMSAAKYAALFGNKKMLELFNTPRA